MHPTTDSNSRGQLWKDYQPYGSSSHANNALPCNRGPTTRHHHYAENTVDSTKASQTVGSASSSNKQCGYSHYSAECSASNGNTHQHDAVPYSRNELFDASTERDNASHRGEDEDEARHSTGHRDYVVNNELNNYVYNTDCFPPINNSNNGDPHFPSTVDVTKGQADAAMHSRGVDYQYEPVSSTDSLLHDLNKEDCQCSTQAHIENIPVNTLGLTSWPQPSQHGDMGNSLWRPPDDRWWRQPAGQQWHNPFSSPNHKWDPTTTQWSSPCAIDTSACTNQWDDLPTISQCWNVCGNHLRWWHSMWANV